MVGFFQEEAELPIEELIKMHDKATAELGEDEEEESDSEGKEVARLKDLVEEDYGEESSGKTSRAESPSKELTDVAEMAATLQPKGYTLSTAQVSKSIALADSVSSFRKLPCPSTAFRRGRIEKKQRKLGLKSLGPKSCVSLP